MRRKTGVLKLALVAAIVLPVIVACQAGGGIPALKLPPGTAVVAPDQGVPADLAAFSGTWGGYWNGSLASLLVVEHVDAEGYIDGVYAWGDSAEYQLSAGSTKFRTKIVGGQFGWGRKIVLKFRHTADGKLLGERYVSGSPAGDVTMTKGP